MDDHSVSVPNEGYTSSAVIGASIGVILIVLLSFITAVLPISHKMDLILLLGMAPGAFCGLLLLSALLGAMIGMNVKILINVVRNVRNRRKKDVY